MHKEITLIHDLSADKRWDIYLQEIENTLNNNRSVIFILPDIESASKIERVFKEKFNFPIIILYRNQPQEMQAWLKIREQNSGMVVGTRSSIFAPVKNLGLIIIEREEDFVYKQEQVPHYHTREVAFMRADIQNTKLILGSSSPSLESFYLAQKNKIRYAFIPREKKIPEIKIIDMRNLSPIFKKKRQVLSPYLEGVISTALGGRGKALLFLNRRGFATFAFCQHCGLILKCPRCNINLVYYLKENTLVCHRCNFRMSAPKICSGCNSGYIRYTGVGTEKLESELSRLFPSARIERIDSPKDFAMIKEADILISTTLIFKEPSACFELVVVLGIDNVLHRIDIRSTEKAFAVLTGLLGLTQKELVIQTSLPEHYCFRALKNNDPEIFYRKALRERRQLKFPPYRHIGLVKLRGSKEDRVKAASEALFKKLKPDNQHKDIGIISVTPGQPAKLRGNFYWQILIRAASPVKLTEFLKKELKNFSHSGIIVTVDIDPI